MNEDFIKALLTIVESNKDSNEKPMKERVKEMLFGFIVRKQTGNADDSMCAMIGAIMYGVPPEIGVSIWNENSEIACLRALGVDDVEIFTRTVYLVGKYNADKLKEQSEEYNKLDDTFKDLQKKHQEKNEEIDNKQKTVETLLKEIEDYLASL